MKIQMIATDLDGTLLRGDGSISPKTQAALSLCRRQGIKLVYATARPMRSLKKRIKECPCDGLVYHNGAVVCAADGFEALASIPHRDACLCMEKLATAFPGIHMTANVEDELYRTFRPAEAERDPGTRISPGGLPQGRVHKLSFDRSQFPDPAVLEPFLPPDTYLQPCEKRLVLVMHKNATKQKGVECLRERFRIPRESVVAFGDDVNDIEMLSFYHGVAMGNALPEVKAAAKETTLSNEEDGVAVFLQRY